MIDSSCEEVIKPVDVKDLLPCVEYSHRSFPWPVIVGSRATNRVPRLVGAKESAGESLLKGSPPVFFPIKGSRGLQVVQSTINSPVPFSPGHPTLRNPDFTLQPRLRDPRCGRPRCDQPPRRWNQERCIGGGAALAGEMCRLGRLERRCAAGPRSATMPTRGV